MELILKPGNIAIDLTTGFGVLRYRFIVLIYCSLSDSLAILAPVPFRLGLLMDAREDIWNNFRVPEFNSSALSRFISDFPKRVNECVENGQKLFKPFKFDGYSIMVKPYNRIDNKLSIKELNLEKQLLAWKENPMWIDHSPEIKVSVPKDSLCKLELTVNVGLPPDSVYNIVTDPNNKRVFKNIKEVISRKVLLDEGSRQIVEVEQAALWRFLWWSGTFSVHVLVDQNRDDYTMKFRQIKSDFMTKFEGCWKMEPIYVDEDLCRPFKPSSLADYMSCTKGRGRIGSKLILEQLIQPSIVPPPPISWYLRGITTRTTEMLINDLCSEAARLRLASSEENLSIGQVIEDQIDFCNNIKERWALRRKNCKRSRKKCT